MNELDLVLLALGALLVLLGWRVGLICSVMSLLAVVVGGGVGFAIARTVLPSGPGDSPHNPALLAVAAIGGIFVAQMIATRPAQRLHDAVVATRGRRLNNLGGAGLTLGFGILVVWMLATALALAPSFRLASQMRESVVMLGLDRALPSDAGPLFNQLESAGLDAAPRVFTGLGLLPAPDVDLPPKDDVSDAARRVAKESVVRVMGHAECGSTLAGSGVVVGEDLVLTNAHVVAGIAAPVVFLEDRLVGVPASPVLFDPVRDAALLRVPGLSSPPVPVAADPQPSELVAVAGYPNGDQLTVDAARVRGLVQATGSDIYGEQQAKRDVLVLAGDVDHGASGGPVLSQDGSIVGLIFASAFGPQDHTGYALGVAEIDSILRVGGSGQPVDTGTCVPED